MKRKRDSPPPSSKRRRRYSNIEDGFAYLSLSGHAPAYHATNSISVEEIMPDAMDTDMSFSQPAYTVEEPTIPEVNMKTLSWFEPERDRIVITDLDSFAQSDDDEEEQSLAVNTALLKKIRAKAVDKSLPHTTTQALVLFRPLPWASAMHEEPKREEAQNEEDMAMEVEL